MAQTTEDLLVRIDATTDRLRNELSKGDSDLANFETQVNRRLGSIDDRFDRLGQAFGKLRGFIAPLAAAVGGVELAGLGRDALRLADELQDVAGQLQISTGFLQDLRYAAGESGVEVGALENSIARLTEEIGSAVAGEKAATESFRRLGIEFQNADGSARSTQEVFGDLADRIQEMPSAADKAAAAALLLGDKAGPRLVALLDQGSEGMRKWGEDASHNMQKMSDDTINRLAAAERALERWKNALVVAAGETAGFFSRLSDSFLSSDFNVETTSNEFESRLVIARTDMQNAADDLRDAEAKLAELLDSKQPDEDRIKRVTDRIARRKAEVNAAKVDILAIQAAYESFLNRMRPGTPRDDRAPPGSLVPTASGGGILPPAAPEKEATHTRELKSALTELLAEKRRQIMLLNEEGIARAALAEVMRAEDAAERDFEAGLRDSPVLSIEEINRIEEISNSLYYYQNLQKSIAATHLESAQASDEFTESLKRLGDTAISEFADVAGGASTARQALASFLGVLAQVLAEKSGVWDTLGNALGKLIGGGSPLPAGIMDDPHPEIIGRAAGGDVMAGRPLWVGENREPELFVPSTNGRIYTANQLGGSGVVVNQTIAVNINGSGGTPAQNADLTNKMMDAFDRLVVERVRQVIGNEQRDRGMLRPNVV